MQLSHAKNINGQHLMWIMHFIVGVYHQSNEVLGTVHIETDVNKKVTV